MGNTRIERSSATALTQKQSQECFSQTLAQEMELTAATLKESLDELQVIGYQEALQGMTPLQIHQGFLRARRTLKWFPKPSEVREMAELEAHESKPKTYYTLGPAPEWSDADRKKFLADIAEACRPKAARK